MTPDTTDRSPASRTAPDFVDERDVRALTETMFVRETAPDLYDVRTRTGGAYHVDTREPACTCPDFQYRDVACKHIRRVELEAGVRDADELAAEISDELDRVDTELASLASRRATLTGLQAALERFEVR